MIHIPDMEITDSFYSSFLVLRLWPWLQFFGRNESTVIIPFYSVLNYRIIPKRHLPILLKIVTNSVITSPPSCSFKERRMSR